MNDGNRNQLVKSSEIEWKPLGEENAEGIYIKSLLFDEEARRSPTFLLKFEPGASYPLHNHPAGEEVFVLEGAVKFGKDELKAGDYLFTAPGNMHRVSTDVGCVLLLKVPQEVEIIKPRTAVGNGNGS
jgi:quercetin dioxygenase-like cupin family protein